MQRGTVLRSFDAHGYRQLDYSTISLYGLEAIKELKTEDVLQAGKIAQLQARLTDDDRRLSKIEERLAASSSSSRGRNRRTAFLAPAR